METQVNSRVDKLRGLMEKMMAENHNVVLKEIEKDKRHEDKCGH